MKNTLVIYLCLITFFVDAQIKKDKEQLHRFTRTEKYFSFNPFGLIEPQVAIGIGYGNRFSERSEYFTELSYVGNNYIYGDLLSSLNGARLLLQYRYHLLQQWKPLFNLHLRYREKKRREQPFVAAEFRLKFFDFSDRNTFINNATHDTLHNVPYAASVISIGGAIVFGSTYKISANGKWWLEATLGIGAKQKFVHFKTVPDNYTIPKFYSKDFGFIPQIYEAVGMPYVPGTIRLRYIID
jgi:hypothetical protein